MKPIAALFLVLILPLAHTAQQKEISLQTIWKSRELSPKYVYGIRSMNDGLHYSNIVTAGKSLAIVKYAYATGQAVDTLFHSRGLAMDDGKPFAFSSYEFNSDESVLLLATNEESVYRYSSRANYYYSPTGSNRITPVTDFSKGKQEQATLSPASNLVAFVRGNNLFVADINTRQEKAITTDGKWAHIINGAIDWVYEEEFGFHKGFYWSPDGNKIAYYRFDESEVPEFSMALYSGLYPDQYKFKYPKAGERNSLVNIRICDIHTGEDREVEIGANTEQYIPRIKWTGAADKLCIMRMNRHQNHLEFLLADASLSGAVIPANLIYSEKADTYIDINDNLLFIDSGAYFFWNSERDGWNHIYLYSSDGRLVSQLTKGEWEVTEFYGVDEANSKIYFSAATNGPLHTALYTLDFALARRNFVKKNKASVPGSDNRATLVKLSSEDKTNRADFSSTFQYFIRYEENTTQPPLITLHSSDGSLIRNMETNEALVKRCEAYNLSKKEFGTFQTSQGVQLHYSIIKPANFDPSRSYPLILMIYGGPGSNRVADRWGGSDYFWHQMLAQKGYIVVSVDPRGTMYRGRDFKHSTYLQLGKLETEDFIETAKYFGSQSWCDSGRIGIMGWSYGGYMSSLCMTKGADYFKLGIAVAPVTNWRYYDTIYTERFLRTPQENPGGYDDNSPINFVQMLKGKYLLIHGSADDNVHYQNSMEMIKALVNADKQFDLFIYPDKNHGIYGGNTRYHLYTKMTDFILSNL